MNILFILYKIILEALFPLSRAEEEMLSMLPEQALGTLPAAPGYEGLVVDLPTSRSLFAYKNERVAKLVWNIKYKKSVAAVKIGGYALWYELDRTDSESKVCLDTPSSSADDAAGSRPPSRPPKRPKNFLSSSASPVTLIIPMPITEKRRRERGYNQCELLVNEIERLEQNAGDQRFIIKKDLLVRTQHASRQTLKGREDRVESAKGIFAVNEKVLEQLHNQLANNSSRQICIKNIPVVIIDDVITTGSTIYEALETLKKAGFEKVSGLSLAH